jgi:hypoxanthine-guanine phosphoribosyltransferase
MLSTPEILRRTGGKPVKSIVFDEAAIATRVQELGAQITEAYPDGRAARARDCSGQLHLPQRPGRTIERPIQIDFLVASSYGRSRCPAAASSCSTTPDASTENIFYWSRI